MKLRVVVCCVVLVVLFWCCEFCCLLCVLCVWCARVPVCVLPLLGKEFHDVPNYTAGR